MLWRRESRCRQPECEKVVTGTRLLTADDDWLQTLTVSLCLSSVTGRCAPYVVTSSWNVRCCGSSISAASGSRFTATAHVTFVSARPTSPFKIDTGPPFRTSIIRRSATPNVMLSVRVSRVRLGVSRVVRRQSPADVLGKLSRHCCTYAAVSEYRYRYRSGLGL